MAVTPFNLEMYRGNTFSFNLSITSDVGVPTNLVGASLRMTVKRDPKDLDAAAVFTRTIGSGITVTNASQGLATVSLSPSNTLTLPATVPALSLFYDIQLTDASANVYTVAYGRLNVKPNISITTP